MNKYTGREWEGPFQAYYYLAPGLRPGGRAVDPEYPEQFGADDPGLYRYVGNSGPNRADPTGRDWDDWLVEHALGGGRGRRVGRLLGNGQDGWFAQTSDFAAGMARTPSRSG